MRPNSIVLLAERFDQGLRIQSVLEPLHRQALVPELAIEGLIRSVLPRFAGIDGDGFNVSRVQPVENGTRDELGAVVRAQVRRRAVEADELRQYLDDSTRTNAAGDIDRQAFPRVLIDHREAF